MKKALIIFVLIFSFGYALSLIHAQTAGTPFALPAPVVITHPLAVGNTGSEVGLLQQLLSNMGYFTYPNVTNYFGPVTKAAVTAFQKANGIDPVGKVGPITRAKISELTTETNESVATPSTETAVNLLGAQRRGGTHRISSRENAIADADGDGVADDVDNCSQDANADQVDADADTVGNSCDNCAMVANADQADDDFDGIGNACEVVSYILAVTNTGGGTVTSAPAGISCTTGTCDEDFVEDTVVTLTAVEGLGSTFIGWTGGGCAGTGVCIVTISADTSVTATFLIEA